jgi:nitrogen fixation/metabolism regulation signal transduction histidine kinase
MQNSLLNSYFYVSKVLKQNSKIDDNRSKLQDQTAKISEQSAQIQDLRRIVDELSQKVLDISRSPETSVDNSKLKKAESKAASLSAAKRTLFTPSPSGVVTRSKRGRVQDVLPAIEPTAKRSCLKL